MSILVEMSGYFGGALSELAQKHGWGARKMFVIAFVAMMALNAVSLMPFESPYNIFMRFGIVFVGAVLEAVFFVFIILIDRWLKRRKSKFGAS